MEEEPEYDIAVAQLCWMVDISVHRIQDAVAATLHRHGIPSARVCVAVVDDARIAELNKTHLGRMGPTDVLAFDLRDDVSHPLPYLSGESPAGSMDRKVASAPRGGPGRPRRPQDPTAGTGAGRYSLNIHALQNGAAVDGEIVLSLETAIREANLRRHGEVAEAALYAVHGTLHLLGYDDQGAQDAERMHAVEDEILQSIGMGTVYGELPT